MKKLLASLAVIAFASNGYAADGKGGFDKAMDDLKAGGNKVENSYKEVPNPLRPFAGTVTSPVGNTIQYFAEGASILNDELVQKTVDSVVKSGKCLNTSAEARHPGAMVGCVVTLAGDGVLVIWNTVGYSAANVIDFGGEAISDLAYIWRDAGHDFAAAAQRAGIPVLSPLAAGAGYVFSFVMNAAGVIVQVSMHTIADGVRGVAQGGTIAISEAVNVPVELLKLQPRKAMESLGIAIGAAGCTVVDAVITTPLRLGAGLLKAIGVGDGRIPGCLERAQKDFDAIKAGTYKAPVKDPMEDMYRN